MTLRKLINNVFFSFFKLISYFTAVKYKSTHIKLNAKFSLTFDIIITLLFIFILGLGHSSGFEISRKQKSQKTLKGPKFFYEELITPRFRRIFFEYRYTDMYWYFNSFKNTILTAAPEQSRLICAFASLPCRFINICWSILYVRVNLPFAEATHIFASRFLFFTHIFLLFEPLLLYCHISFVIIRME